MRMLSRSLARRSLFTTLALALLVSSAQAGESRAGLAGAKSVDNHLVVVGGGPVGMMSALALANAAKKAGRKDVKITVLESRGKKRTRAQVFGVVPGMMNNMHHLGIDTGDSRFTAVRRIEHRDTQGNLVDAIDREPWSPGGAVTEFDGLLEADGSTKWSHFVQINHLEDLGYEAAERLYGRKSKQRQPGDPIIEVKFDAEAQDAPAPLEGSGVGMEVISKKNGRKWRIRAKHVIAAEGGRVVSRGLEEQGRAKRLSRGVNSTLAGAVFPRVPMRNGVMTVINDPKPGEKKGRLQRQRILGSAHGPALLPVVPDHLQPVGKRATSEERAAIEKWYRGYAREQGFTQEPQLGPFVFDTPLEFQNRPTIDMGNGSMVTSTGDNMATTSPHSTLGVARGSTDAIALEDFYSVVLNPNITQTQRFGALRRFHKGRLKSARRMHEHASVYYKGKFKISAKNTVRAARKASGLLNKKRRSALRQKRYNRQNRDKWSRQHRRKKMRKARRRSAKRAR